MTGSLPRRAWREESGQVARSLYGGPGGDADAHAHLDGDDVGEGGLAQAGGPVEEDVVQGLVPLLGGGDGDAQVVLDLLLAHVVGQVPGTEGGLEGYVFLMGLSRKDAFGHSRVRL